MAAVSAGARALQQQVVEAESDVEGGIADPRAFRVKKDGALRAFQNVLRADVAVHQRPPGRKRLAGEHLVERGELRMLAPGRAQIGLDPDRLECPVMRERRAQTWVRRASGMDQPESRPTEAANSLSTFPARSSVFHSA